MMLLCVAIDLGKASVGRGDAYQLLILTGVLVDGREGALNGTEESGLM